MDYHDVPQPSGSGAGKLKAFATERSVHLGSPLSLLLYVLALEPLSRRLRDEGVNPAFRGIPFAGPLTAKVSAFADDITVFVSRLQDIEAVKKVVAGYERIRRAKVNFDKSEGLQLGAWTGSDTLPGPFHWSDGPIRILGVWFEPHLQLERNCLEVQANALCNLLGFSDLSQSRKELYRELVVGCASDPLSEPHDWTAEEVRSHWSSRSPGLHGTRCPLLGLNFRAGLADMLDCARCGSGLEETDEHAFYYCEWVRPFWDHVGEWTARIVLLDVGYVVDNVLPLYQGGDLDDVKEGIV